MKEFPSKHDFKKLARTALAASLPLAAGISACGDGPTSSGIPARIETPMSAPQAPINPTPEPGRTTITLEAECTPTDPNPPEFYTLEARRIANENGGAIIIRTYGLTCKNDNVPYAQMILGQVDHKAQIVRPIGDLAILGYADGSEVTNVIPVDSCDGEYALLQVNPDKKSAEKLLVPDEKTGVPLMSFKLYEDCITEIKLEVESPPDLN